MHRPAKAGDKVRTTVATKEIQEISLSSNGALLKSEKKEMLVGFEGVVEVLEVEANGKPVKISATVEKIMKSDGRDSSEVAPKGAVIVVSLEGRKQIYQINGKPAGADVVKALDLVFSISKTGVTDDDVFGTKEKKKTGESWNINAAVAKKDLEESFGLRVEDLHGKVTLDEVLKRPEGETLLLSAKMTINAIPPMPPDFAVDQSTAEAEFGGEFPVNVASHRPAENMSMKMDVVAHGKTRNGEKISLKMHMQSEKKVKREPSK